MRPLTGRYLGENTPAEMAEELARRAFWKEASAVDLPPRCDEADMPPVDEEALQRWVRGELPEAAKETLAVLCVFYRSWAEALLRAKLQEDLRTRAENTPEEQEAEERRRGWWRQFAGQEEPPPWRDETDAPPVSADVLRRFARRELPERERTQVVANILLYRSWARAYLRIGGEMFPMPPGSGKGTEPRPQ